MVKISEFSTLSPYEAKKSKNEPDYLLLGKSDKKLSLVSDGIILPLIEMSQPTRTGSNHGYLIIPTTDKPYIIQYGLEAVSDPSTDINFPITFPNSCLTFQATHRGGDATAIKGRWVDAEKLRIEVVGGSGNQTVFWFAMGF